MQFQTRLFIGGEFVDAVEGGRIEVLNPHDNSRIAEVAEARAADLDRAVAAASKAFPAWRATPAADCCRLLLKLADAIEAHEAELAEIESLDTGHPIRDSRGLDVPQCAERRGRASRESDGRCRGFRSRQARRRALRSHP